MDMKSSGNFRIPAEWEPHEAVWLAWPYDKISFGSLNRRNHEFDPGLLPRVEQRFAEIIAELAKGERVDILIRDLSRPPATLPPGLAKRSGAGTPGEGNNIRFHEVDYADVWTRDYTPSFVIQDLIPAPSFARRGSKIQAVKWEYDAYSKKFPDLLKDNEIFNPSLSPLNLRGDEGGLLREIEILKPGIVMEGGAIEVNGQGILLTTEQCLLKRNPNLSKRDIEKVFEAYLGIKKVIWLKQGIVNDHTDGHIDELAKFVAPNKIVCAFEEDSNDPNYQVLSQAFEVLKIFFEVIKLPMPHLTYHNGQKAPASYVNFFIANKVVLVPTFGDPNDDNALEIIGKQFPERDILGIDSTEIIYGGGAIHCATREQPAA